MNKTLKNKLVDMKVLMSLSRFGWDPINCTVTSDKEMWDALLEVESRRKLKLYKGKKFKDYEVLLELMGDEDANGDNMRSAGQLIDKNDIADDLDNIGIDTESVPLTQNHAVFDYGQSDQDYQSTASTQVPSGIGTGYVPTTSTPLIADPTTSYASSTPSAAISINGHTSSQTRSSAPTAKRQQTRPTTHVLDTGINVMTTKLSCITYELVVRRELDWTMGLKVEATLRGITGFEMTHLFTALEIIMKEKPFCAWFLSVDDETRGIFYILDIEQRYTSTNWNRDWERTKDLIYLSDFVEVINKWVKKGLYRGGLGMISPQAWCSKWPEDVDGDFDNYTEVTFGGSTLLFNPVPVAIMDGRIEGGGVREHFHMGYPLELVSVAVVEGSGVYQMFEEVATAHIKDDDAKAGLASCGFGQPKELLVIFYCHLPMQAALFRNSLT
ncbi:hypothetical protein GIB67_033972 [Kingdonia uniflora]|uniref:Myb/SANT-like domain-containing protein n=1 Tax=Kingdonia uniflora TaxID=39325 RepID=A0A7J7M5Y0_9MAGN|nr:hypothetical protein GIB67_033972 [Kingdonia uniflora]